MHQKIKKVFFYSGWFFSYSCCTVFYLIISIPLRFSKKYKNLWLISERPEEARDNGYWLYKWILENRPETNVRYVLANNSTDYNKMPRKDLIIEPNSAIHHICHILSSYSISTHMHGASPGKSFCIPFLPFMRKKKTVFLQHGITQNKINLRGKLDYIIAASKPEKELLIEANPKYKDRIYIAGFCRYDQLEDLSKKQKIKTILVMPTFRKWLRDIARLKYPDSTFKNTDYYKYWNSFLKNNELKTILSRNDMELIFFPHNEMQKLAHNFKSNNDRIKIGKPGEFDIQELLKKSSILITDYSSVFFDFVYMNKPVIFYQFDQKDFYTKHYTGSGKASPFGNTFANEDELIKEIDNTIKRNCTLKNKYKNDAMNFYGHRDKKNCERVYTIITKPVRQQQSK
ncbi:CDP-glycerol glycerophosphotransferase family protein [Candidatus Saccharibacteria bacterium]|nr:CDP-glycerol glycerophosphotransferase family protein [Candidatus Saccharibacteria bacterium]